MRFQPQSILQLQISILYSKKALFSSKMQIKAVFTSILQIKYKKAEELSIILRLFQQFEICPITCIILEIRAVALISVTLPTVFQEMSVLPQPATRDASSSNPAPCQSRIFPPYQAVPYPQFPLRTQ